MVRLSETELVVGRLKIPLAEIVVRAMRSSGPGGQHANKTESRIEASLDIEAAESLGPRQRLRLQARFGDSVRAVAQDARSQSRNKDLALLRLGEKIEDTLRVQRRRVATKPSTAAKARRLKSKSVRSDVKSLRRKPSADD